jgi:NADH:ubiquinone oxidoreductase subunit F (NADH-binding)
MHDILQRITRGLASSRDLEMLTDLCEMVSATSLCGLGQSAPNPVLTTLRYFKQEYLEHIHAKRCVAGECQMAAGAAS